MQQSVRNLWAKFEVDSLSRFRTGARQVFTTQKLFPSEISVTMKIATTNSLFKYIFWSNNYHLSNLFWNPWRQTNRYSSKEVNIWAASGYFPFFIPFFCWNEIKKKSSREDTKKIRSSRSPRPATLLKRDFAPGVFLWILQNFQEYFSNRTPPVATSERWKIVKAITLQRNFLHKLLEIG